MTRVVFDSLEELSGKAGQEIVASGATFDTVRDRLRSGRSYARQPTGRVEMPTTLAGIPLDHVVAEVTAFPLSSEASLELGLTELAPDLSDSTGHLWRRSRWSVVSGMGALWRRFPARSTNWPVRSN